MLVRYTLTVPSHVVTSGDLFASGADVLVNPVNCVGVMGAGLALAFKRRFPQMFDDYKQLCAQRVLTVDNPVLWTNENGPDVLLFATKHHWRDPSQMQYIHSGLKALTSDPNLMTVGSLAVPALGCGLGQLDFDEVLPVLTDALRLWPADVKIFRPV